MSQMEQYSASIDTDTERVHIPRTRTLVQRTHDALMANEVLSPEMYGDVFPEHDSMLEGLEATYDNLQATYAEVQRPDVPTERLIELFQSTNLTGQYMFGPFSATTGGSYVLEANRILGQDEQPTAADIEASEVYAKVIYPQELAHKADTNELHPEEYYHVIGSLALQHVRAFDHEHIPPSVLAMRLACQALASGKLAGYVTSMILDTLQHRLGTSDEYYTLRNKLPYKRIIFPLPEAAGFYVQHARDAIDTFEAMPHSEQPFPSDISRHGNYEAALRVVCGSYASLRKAGYAQPDAIGALYAHGAVFRNLTKASTDAYAFRPPDGMRRPTQDEHLFAELYEELVDVVEDADHMPHLQLEMNAPYVRAQMPDSIPEPTALSFAQKRKSAGRCPARHLVAGISGDRPDNIARLSADITKDYGVDPRIQGNTSIQPTSLIMAMTIRQAEKYDLFDVLDKRFAEERML